MKLQELPASLSLLNDHAKTTITLTSGILALSGTFVVAFTDHPIQQAGWVFLIASWFFLIVSMALSIFVTGGVVGAADSEKIEDEAWDKLASQANWSFWLLLVGLISLAISVPIAQAGALRGKAETLSDALRVVEGANDRLCRAKKSFERLRTAAFDKTLDQWTLVLMSPCQDERSQSYITATVVSGSMTSVQRFSLP